MKIQQITQLTTLIIGMIFNLNLSFGQISQGGIPYSFSSNMRTAGINNVSLSETITTIQMPDIKPSIINQLKENNTKGDESFQFAYGFDVNINLKDFAKIDSLENGLLYRLSIKSLGAYSINLIFKEYYLPLGAKLFIYSKDKSDLKGAFTSNNNKVSKRLPTVPIKGDEIIVEYFEPFFPQFEGKVIIGKISHDFLGISNEDGDFGLAGPCQVDINCSEGKNWKNEKRAVCKVIYNGEGMCSGTLLNNINNDGTPYFLTAFHCLDKNLNGSLSNGEKSKVSDLIVVFNYESSTCGGSDGSVSKSISGAFFRAARFESDFLLLELSKKPFAIYNPYYAGWDRNDVQSVGGVGIHHPWGDVKKISTFNIIPPNSIDCFRRVPNENFYKINWVATANGHGVTEPASSGSPLFNNEKRVIGQLKGASFCANPNCNDPANDNSNYGKLFASWDLGNSASERLKDWLAPNSNAMTLDGSDVCNAGTKVNLNITHTVASGSVKLYQATDVITASNIIEAGATVTYEAGKQIRLTDGFHAKAGSNFRARIKDFNCIATCDPINLTAWTSSVCRNDDLCFNIINASNYTISIHSGTGQLVHQSSGNITGSTTCIWNTTGIVPEIYLATVSFSTDCETISNTYQISVSSCNRSADGTSESTTKQEKTKLQTSIKEVNNPNFSFDIFPNPNDGNFTLKLNTSNSVPYSLEIINSIGMVTYKMEHINANQVNINQTGFAKGIYYIKLISGNNTATKKISIQ